MRNHMPFSSSVIVLAALLTMPSAAPADMPAQPAQLEAQMTVKPTPSPMEQDGMAMNMKCQDMMGGDMRRMMAMMRDMMAMMSARSAMMPSHIDERLASLKSELQITEAQMPQWTGFAEALRTAEKSMEGMHQQMMREGRSSNLPARLANHEKILAEHLNSLKAVEAALQPLYATFSDVQKKRADDLMIGPMGVM